MMAPATYNKPLAATATSTTTNNNDGSQHPPEAEEEQDQQATENPLLERMAVVRGKWTIDRKREMVKAIFSQPVEQNFGGASLLQAREYGERLKPILRKKSQKEWTGAIIAKHILTVYHL
jgi:hypothetical protein